MASLTAHLVESGDHGRLGFHPDCPVCRQVRLFGSLSADPVISRRAQAALASGVLALSAVGPPAAVAQEPDQQVEGGSEPAPGGGTGDTEAEVGPPPTLAPPPAPDLDPQTPEGAEASELLEVVPVQTEPVEAPTGQDNPGADSGTAPDPVDPEGPRPNRPPEAIEPESPMEAPGTTQPPAEAEAPQAMDAPASEGPPERQAQDTVSLEETAEALPRDLTAPPPAEGVERLTAAAEPAPAPLITPATAVAAPPPAPAPGTTTSDPAPEGKSSSGPKQDFVVVQPGDSLWSIAKRLLGPDASPAQIARKVSRLWDLNDDRIGTGRPDLILVGTKLRLR
jgi:hypothetical protein